MLRSTGQHLFVVSPDAGVWRLDTHASRPEWSFVPRPTTIGLAPIFDVISPEGSPDLLFATLVPVEPLSQPWLYEYRNDAWSAVPDMTDTLNAGSQFERVYSVFPYDLMQVENGVLGFDDKWNVQWTPSEGWTRVSGGQSANAYDAAPQLDGTIWAGSAKMFAEDPLFVGRSVDYFETQEQGITLPESTDWELRRVEDIEVSPFSNDEVWFGISGRLQTTYFTSDAGATWSRVALDADCCAQIEVSGSTAGVAFATNGGSVFRLAAPDLAPVEIEIPELEGAVFFDLLLDESLSALVILSDRGVGLIQVD